VASRAGDKSVPMEFVDSTAKLTESCRRLADSQLIAFDTEFVSEDTYRPELCLIQVATESQLVVIDPLAVPDVTPFWELVVSPQRRVVVHAGREEILFCYRATGQTIPGLFDCQLAYGLVSGEFPISYANLVQRLAGLQLDKEETRSDWRRRPLSDRQLQYAIQDVAPLPSLFTKLQRQLATGGRDAWFAEEADRRQESLARSVEDEQWHRISGIQHLSDRQLGIVRRLWQWRDQEAASRDVPPRRVLRDDLIIELAKRGSSDLQHIGSIRGLEHRHLRPRWAELAECIEQGKQMEIPRPARRSGRGQPNPPQLLVQFLTASLAFICRSQRISPALIGTTDDVKEFVRYRLQGADQQPLPALLEGWRGQIVGNQLDAVLRGELALCLDDPLQEMPLKFCRPGSDPNAES